MRKTLIFLPLLASCGLAHAIGPSLYLGAGVTQAKLDNVGKDFNTGSLSDFKLDNTAWKAILGVRPLKVLAVEANYVDLGNERRTVGGVQFNADSKAFSAFAVGFLPVPIVDLYAKAGLAHWQARATFSTLPGLRLDDSGNEFAYGAGAQVHLGKLGARLEYEQFNVPHTDGVELLTLGVTYTFDLL